MKRADFEVPVRSPLPYIAALLSAAALFFATFLIFADPDTDIAGTAVLPENITYTYGLLFRYSEGIPFYDICFLFTYAALAVLCFIPAAKKRPLILAIPFLSHVISAFAHGIEVYKKLIDPATIFFLIFIALFALTSAGIIRVKYVAGILFAVIALICALPALFYKISITAVCDDIPTIAFFAAYALICFSFKDRSKEQRQWNTPSDKSPTRER